MSVEGETTLYWYVARSLQKQNAGMACFTNALQEHGYKLSYENSLTKLHEQALGNTQQKHNIYILQGSPTEIIAATTKLRSINSDLGILALLPSHNEMAFSQALLCGADAYATTETSTPLLLAIVNSILRRIGHNVLFQNENKGWFLYDEAWQVVSPEGIEVNLTTTERALFLAFIDAPEGRVSHSDLLSSLDIDGNANKTIRLNRLGVVVSRLRRKFEANGLSLPLKSLHNWGYMFVVPLHRR